MAAVLEEKFPWDFDKPEDAFWKDIGWKESRSFFGVFPSREVAQSSVQARLPGDTNLDLPHNDKLQLLIDILEQRLQNLGTLAAPTPLRVADNTTWRNIYHSIRILKGSLGDSSSEEKIMLMLMSHNPEVDGPQKNMSEHHSMAFKFYEKGQYAEAQEMGKEVLEWLEKHRMCGPDSPQALSMRRLLVKTAWKSGDERENEERIKELRVVVDGLPEGNFKKYAEEEREMLEDLVVELKG